jgi:hypothetical protein
VLQRFSSEEEEWSEEGVRSREAGGPPFIACGGSGGHGGRWP